MNVDLLGFARFLQRYWYEKLGLIVALIVLLLLVGFILATGQASKSTVIATLSLVSVAVFIAWRVSLRPPKTKKESVGFVVSIYSDNDAESRRIREDFVIPLRNLVRSSESGQRLHFIEYPAHLARQIRDEGDAEKLRVKSRAHFMIYGTVRERILNGKELHVVDLQGKVSHKPIPLGTHKIFSREFSELLPSRINIDKENDLLSFQFTSEFTDIVAKYIIGIASFLSSDIDYAEKLYLDSQERLQGKNQEFPIFAKLVERIPIRLSEIHQERAQRALDQWRATHDQKFTLELREHLGKVSDKRKDDPRIVLLNAVSAFLNGRDIQASREHLKQLKSARKGTADANTVAVWNYNMAFLYCYEGDLATAIRHYRKAANCVAEPDVLSQVEDFLCWVLEEEPDKYQIHYALGFFNWKTKGDLIRAKIDFENFLESGREGESDKERELAKKWIEEMTVAQTESNNC